MAYQELFKKLPHEIREAMSSAETSKAIEQIADKYHLLIDKMGILAEETGMVMLGASHPKDFIRNISSKLGVDTETAKKIAGDVNEQIFSKVRESLKKLHGITEEETPVPAPSAPPAMKEYPVQIRREQVGESGKSSETDLVKVSERRDQDDKNDKSLRLVNMNEKKSVTELAPLEIRPANIPSSPNPPVVPQAEKPTATAPPGPMPPKPSPPAGVAFADKIQERVSVQSPELRKIERPTIDPYREPIE